MHRVRTLVRILVLLVILAVAGAGAWAYLNQQSQTDDRLRASGTIEAESVSLGPQLPGRVAEVRFDEGNAVAATDTVVVLEGATLESQREQAEAAVRAAESNVSALESNAAAATASAAAADANVALLAAGPTPEQLAVAQAALTKAQVAVGVLQATYDGLSSAERDSLPGVELRIRRDLARADLTAAEAQHRLVAAGNPAGQVEAAQAQADAARAQAEAAAKQVDAARAQIDAARAALAAVEAQLGQLTILTPVDGVVLTRAVEPGEYAVPGAPLIVVGQLDSLSITCFVPEDRLGEVTLGQSAEVRVDSFADETFTATVEHIAHEAEFTPRNVQTAEGRRTTVFAIRLAIANRSGRLKPGMPADVAF